MKRHRLQQDSNIQKVNDRYFSKIRSRKIEKCLLQLQETLRKNETSSSCAASRNMDMPMLIDNNCNMHKILNNKKCTQSNAARICEDNNNMQNSSISNNNFNWTNAYAQDLEQTQNDENLAYYGKLTTDPNLCMLFMQTGWSENNYFNDVSARNCCADEQRMDYLLQNSMPTMHDDNVEMLKIEYLQQNMNNLQSNNVYLSSDIASEVTKQEQQQQQQQLDLKHFMPFNAEIMLNANAAEQQAYQQHDDYAVENLYSECYQHD